MIELVTKFPEPFITAIIASFGWILAQWLRRKPRLQYSVGHSWNHLVDQPLLDQAGTVLSEQQLVRTASINVINAGSEPASSIEITFNWKPPNFNIWPARNFAAVVGDDRRFTIKLESLAPKEFIRIEIMSINAELPLLTCVRSRETEGALIQMGPQRIWSNWILSFLMLLMATGAVTIIYLAVSFAYWLAALGS